MNIFCLFFLFIKFTEAKKPTTKGTKVNILFLEQSAVNNGVMRWEKNYTIKGKVDMHYATFSSARIFYVYLYSNNNNDI